MFRLRYVDFGKCNQYIYSSLMYLVCSEVLFHLRYEYVFTESHEWLLIKYNVIHTTSEVAYRVIFMYDKVNQYIRREGTNTNFCF